MWSLEEPHSQEGKQGSDQCSVLQNEAFSDILSRINFLPCSPHMTSHASVIAYLKLMVPFGPCV